MESSGMSVQEAAVYVSYHEIAHQKLRGIDFNDRYSQLGDLGASMVREASADIAGIFAVMEKCGSDVSSNVVKLRRDVFAHGDIAHYTSELLVSVRESNEYKDLVSNSPSVDDLDKLSVFLDGLIYVIDEKILDVPDNWAEQAKEEYASLKQERSIKFKSLGQEIKSAGGLNESILLRLVDAGFTPRLFVKNLNKFGVEGLKVAIKVFGLRPLVFNGLPLEDAVAALGGNSDKTLGGHSDELWETYVVSLREKMLAHIEKSKKPPSTFSL